MGSTVVLRSRSAQALGATMMALSAAGVLTGVIDGVETLLRFGAPISLFGVLGWGAFWKPNVEITDGGVTVTNIARTIEVPWPAIDSVDGRYGLRLETAYGRVTAWGAAAPAGRQRARSQQSPAAVAVTRRLDELRAAGHLLDPKLERPAAATTWHRPVVVVLGVLAVATPLLPLLT